MTAARVVPAHCLLCGARGAAGMDLCTPCRRELPHNDCCCPQCALPLHAPAARCGQCQRRPPPWRAAWAPLRYAWPVDRLQARHKFRGRLAAGRVLAGLWGDCRPPPMVPALVPVPLHPARLRQRGYDQTLELARQLARELDVPLYPRALRRVRATHAQSDLHAAARRRNVRGAFALRAGVALPAHVALFDDVMTTGATLAECTRLLQRHGVQCVDVWALARVPASTQ